MAVKFYLPDGQTVDVIGQNWPVFPAGTRDLLRARHQGEAATERFLSAHPDVAEASQIVAAAGAPPRSWATVLFYSINAFRLVNAAGDGQWVRWRLSPEADQHSLPEDQWATAGRDYLMTGILDELPVRYRLLAQLAADGDQTTDPSRAWPEDRELADLGTIEITAPNPARERDGVLIHDPKRLIDGVEPSDDPILRIRPYVYAESIRRRTGGQHIPGTASPRSRPGGYATQVDKESERVMTQHHTRYDDSAREAFPRYRPLVVGLAALPQSTPLTAIRLAHVPMMPRWPKTALLSRLYGSRSAW